MKFSDLFFSRGSRIVSAFIGVFMGILAGLVFGWRIGVLSGAVIAVLSSFIIPTVSYIGDAPYRRIKKELPKPFLLDIDVFFVVKTGMIYGYFVVTKESLILISRGKERHCLHLTRESVRSVILGEDDSMKIFLNETQFVQVLSKDVETVCRLLWDNGWSGHAST